MPQPRPTVPRSKVPRSKVNKNHKAGKNNRMKGLNKKSATFVSSYGSDLLLVAIHEDGSFGGFQSRHGLIRKISQLPTLDKILKGPEDFPEKEDDTTSPRLSWEASVASTYSSSPELPDLQLFMDPTPEPAKVSSSGALTSYMDAAPESKNQHSPGVSISHSGFSEQSTKTETPRTDTSRPSSPGLILPVRPPPNEMAHQGPLSTITQPRPISLRQKRALTSLLESCFT